MNKGFVINISMFSFLLGLINMGCVTFLFLTKENVISNIDGIAFHLSMLTTCITFVTILLAISGIVGYNGIKSSAEEHAENVAQTKAEEVANEVANRIMASFINNQVLQNNNFDASSQNQDTDITPASQAVSTGVII